MEKIRSQFQKRGFNPNSFIRKNDYYDFLNSLMKGQGFDRQIADELWQQTAEKRQGVNELRVDDICSTIVQGQNIIRNQLQKLNQQLQMCERSKQYQIQNSRQGKHSSKIAKIDSDIADIFQNIEQYEENLRLLTEPFGINNQNMPINRYPKHQPTSHTEHYPMSPGYQSQTYAPLHEDQTTQLKWVLYLTLAFCFLEIIIIYGKYDFLNLIVITCLLSIYLLNFFDQIYIKFTLALLIVSEILDIIWMFIYASAKWNPPKIGNNSIYEEGYLRFIVAFTIIIILIKLPLGFFLFKYRNANPQNKYTLSLGLVKIVLSANKSNPISRGLNTNLAS